MQFYTVKIYSDFFLTEFSHNNTKLAMLTFLYNFQRK